MQLAIEDAIKTGRLAIFIEKLATISQKLRAPILDAILKQLIGMGALMRNKTRWGSVYLMVRRLLKIKPQVKDLPSEEVKLTELEWGKLERLVTILEIPHKATITLQRENLTPGQCLLELREVQFRLKKLGDETALNIAKCIESREKKLFENSIFEAAVWIESRSRVLLTDAQKATAKETLQAVYQRIEQSLSSGDQVRITGPIMRNFCTE